MRKTAFTMMSILVVLMALSLAFLIPSGAITEDAVQRYSDALDSSEDELDEFAQSARTVLKPVAVLANAVFSDILPAANVNLLDVDLTTPGKAPITANFTEAGYRDDTIIVELEKKRMYESDVFIAYVKVATAAQIRTAIAGDKISSTRTNHPTAISDNYNGIVAVNGDFYTGTKAGYIVRQGEVYREKPSKNMDLLLIDEYGDFHILLHGADVQANAIEGFKSEHKIVNGFMFGPALVIDGATVEIPSDYQFAPNAKNPRAGIGQIGPLTYAIVVVNGRTDKSAGVTLMEFSDIMNQINCQQAYNLDGGNSATMVFHGAVYNDKPQAERSVTDIIYFASAIE